MGNIEGLREHQEQSKKETFDKVIKAISNLKKSKKKITYKTVAEKAGISESTLYKYDELKERIRQAKVVHELKTAGDLPSEERIRYKNPKDRKIEELKEQIQKYKEENEEQRKINALLLGNLEKKTAEVIELKTRLKASEKIFKLER